MEKYVAQFIQEPTPIVGLSFRPKFGTAVNQQRPAIELK